MRYELINGLGVYMGEICEVSNGWAIFNKNGKHNRTFKELMFAKNYALSLGYVINKISKN